jgi:hypothetical protein
VKTPREKKQEGILAKLRIGRSFDRASGQEIAHETSAPRDWLHDRTARVQLQ